MAKNDSTPKQLPLPIDGATVEIPLTKGYVAIVDAIDADLVTNLWFFSSGQGRAGYAQRNINNKGIKLHRIILSRILGRELISSEIADHANGDTLDNRRSNLRLATLLQNSQNVKRRIDNTSGYKGVYWKKDKNKWAARLRINNKCIWLGCFDSAEDAYFAYCEAAKKYFGEFARLE